MSPIRQLLALCDSYEVYATVINPLWQLQKKKSSMSLLGHRRNQYFSSIHSWDSSPWQVLYIPLFCFFVCVSCSACIFQMCSKPNQFFIQIKVYFFIIFCFLNWNCTVIIHNFITFLPFPNRFTMFFIYFDFNIILHFILKFTSFFTTRFISNLF